MIVAIFAFVFGGIILAVSFLIMRAFVRDVIKWGKRGPAEDDDE